MKTLFNCLFLLLVWLLSGCSTPVLNQTNSFVNAGQSVVKTAQAAQSDSITQINDYRKALISGNFVVAKVPNSFGEMEDAFVPGNGQCSINSYTYLRYPNSAQQLGEPFFRTSLAIDILKETGVYTVSLKNKCAALQSCESYPDTATCRTLCYSSDESACITAIGNAVAKLQVKDPDIRAKLSVANTAKAQQIDGLSLTLTSHSYPITVALDSQAAVETLGAFANYLDILQKAATPQPTEFDKLIGNVGGDSTKTAAENASTLATNVETLRSRYNSVTQTIKFLPSVNGVSDSNLTKQLGALGQLASVLNEIKKNDNASRSVKDILNDNVDAYGNLVAVGTQNSQMRWMYINAEIKSIGQTLANDLQNNNAIKELANYSMRSIYANAFNRETLPELRLAAINALDNYPPIPLTDYVAEQTAVGKQLPKTIDALIASHTQLVQLINDPTSKERIQAVEAGAENLRGVIQALNGVISYYK